MRILLLLAVLVSCTGCAGRVVGPQVADTTGEDIHGEGHTLAEYCAIVQALDADPDSWPAGWVK